MTEPLRRHIQAIEREFANAFPLEAPREMTPQAFDELLEAMGYRDGDTIHDRAALSRRSADGYPVLLPADLGREGVSWECYDAQREDWLSALERARRAEAERDIARRCLGWIGAALWIVAALAAAAVVWLTR